MWAAVRLHPLFCEHNVGVMGGRFPIRTVPRILSHRLGHSVGLGRIGVEYPKPEKAVEIRYPTRGGTPGFQRFL
jgi:hypothetical protein